MFDDVYILPVGSRRLVFSPWRGVAAVVSPSGASALAQWAGPHHGLRPPPELAPLTEALACPPERPPDHQGPPFLGLIATRACNMACGYCDFGGEELADGVMKPEVAIGAINGWAARIRDWGAGELNLHFFGGEPFVAPDLVQVAVHRTRALAAEAGLPTHFEASTNGLLDDATIGFVQDYFDVLVVSLDGQQADHDRHRPLPDGMGSFSRVCRTLRRLRDGQVDICLRCCVSSANVEHMAAIAEWFAGEFQPRTINFEPMRLGAGCRGSGLTVADPAAFARGFIAARRVARAAGVECTFSALFDASREGFCPVSRGAYIVAPNGSVRCCYLPARQWRDLGLDLEIGSVGEDGALRVDAAAVRRVRQLSPERPRCHTCFCRAGCGGGCLAREGDPPDAAGFTDFCRMTRLIQAAALLDDLDQADVADTVLSAPAALAALLNRPDDRLGANGP